ncbi:MAG: hypothetical protein WCV55_02005 [Candidatus Paceibacterota bacterium]
MRFLKIDKKNIFSFSKIILVIAFVAIFTFGFAEKSFAQSNYIPGNFTTGGVGSVSTYFTDKSGNMYISGLKNAPTGTDEHGLPTYTQTNYYNQISIDSTGKLIQGPEITDSAQISALSKNISPVDGSSLTMLEVAPGQTITIGNKTLTYDSNQKAYIVTDNTSGYTQTLDPSDPKTSSEITDFTNSEQNRKTQKDANTEQTGVGKKNTNKGLCWNGINVGFDVQNCLYQALYYALFWPISWLVGMAGWLFDFVFTQTVVEMASGIKKIGGIDIAWKVMRDLSNIGFIFILLYLAISTIIGAGEHDVKKTLSKLIIIAILLNFSLFFTKAIIDASNILAIAFFKAIVITGDDGLGSAFMHAFRLQGLFGTSTSSGEGVAASSQSFAVIIGGIITMLVATIILLASLMMFIKRYVILILILVFSPLAFAGMVLHQTEHYVQEWWSTLFKEAFFAPIYMILIWISFTIITDPSFGAAIGYTNEQTLSDSFSSTATGKSSDTSMAGVILSFIIVSALLVSSLIVAEKMGVAGAQGAMNFAKGAQGAIQGGIGGWVGANTLGRFGNTILNKGPSAAWLQDARSGRKGNTALSRFAFRQIGKAGVGITAGLSASKYGGETSYEEKKKQRLQEMKDVIEEHHGDPKVLADLIAKGTGDVLGNYGTDTKAVHDMIHSMTPEQIADAKIELKKTETKTDVEGGTEKMRSQATNALKLLSDDHAGGRLSKELAKKVESVEKAGRPGHLEALFTQDENHRKIALDRDRLRSKWAAMENGQRRYAMETMSVEEAELLQSHLVGMVDTMKESDTAAVENLLKSGKATELVKKVANNTVTSSAIRTNLYSKWEKATTAEEKEAYSAEFGNLFKDESGNSLVISTNKPSTSDKSITELYNKNLNRYSKLSEEEEASLRRISDMEDAISGKKAAEKENKAAEKQAQANTKNIVSLVKSVSDILGQKGSSNYEGGGGI